MADEIPSLKLHVDEEIVPTSRIGGSIIQIAPLQTVNLHELRKQDSGELQKLQSAAHYPGFCYIDLQGTIPFLQTANQNAQACCGRVQEENVRDQQGCRAVTTEMLTWSGNGEGLTKHSHPTSPGINSFQDEVRQFRKSCEDIAAILTSAMNVPNNVAFSSRLQAFTGDSVAAQRSEHELLSIIFQSDKDPKYTTEIRLTRTGLSDEKQWAHVVPKRGCALLAFKGSHRRISSTLPGQSNRTWVECQIVGTDARNQRARGMSQGAVWSVI